MPSALYLPVDPELHILKPDLQAQGHTTTSQRQLTPRSGGSATPGPNPVGLGVISVVLFSVLVFVIFGPNLIDRIRARRAQRRVLRELDRAEADARGDMEQARLQEEGMEKIFQSSVGPRVVETLRGKKPGYRGGIVIAA